MPEPNRHFDAFLSYSHSGQETEIARQIADALQEQGVRLFADTRDLMAGQNWRKAVSDAIQKADLIIAMVGEDSYLNSAASAEWSEIQRRVWKRGNLRLVPIAIGDAKLPPFLQDWQSLRIDPDDPEAGKKVADALNEMYKGSPPPRQTKSVKQEFTQLQQRFQTIDKTVEAWLKAEEADEDNYI